MSRLRKLCRRPVVTGCAVAAGVLTLIGSLVPLYSTPIQISDAEWEVLVLDSWRVASERTNGDSSGTLLLSTAAHGYSLVFAAVLLFAAAAVSVRSAATRSAPARVAVLTVAGAAFLAGVGVSVGIEVVRFAATWGLGVEPSPVPAAVGPGLWLLGAAVLLAVAAAVVAWLRVREAEPVPPPISVPVVRRVDEPEAPDGPEPYATGRSD
jgi:hypothetical protein